MLTIKADKTGIISINYKIQKLVFKPKSLIKTVHNLQLQPLPVHCFILLLNSCQFSLSFKALGSEDHREQPLN